MTNYFNQICEFRQKYPVFSAKAIKTNNPILNDVKKALNNLKLQLEIKISKIRRYRSKNRSFKRSRKLS